jgi:hypothetical protein
VTREYPEIRACKRNNDIWHNFLMVALAAAAIQTRISNHATRTISFCASAFSRSSAVTRSSHVGRNKKHVRFNFAEPFVMAAPLRPGGSADFLVAGSADSAAAAR